MRQIVLDTETTGLETSLDHRIIEIGAVELVGRRLTGRHYHQYIKPEREIDAGALAIHGISNAMLEDKPIFARIAADFLAFIEGAELIIHNAPFDTGFIDHELRRLDPAAPSINHNRKITDTLKLARAKHPGQKNNLDALCKRYGVDNSQRELHGALLDAEILADVYLLMTGGQTSLSLGSNQGKEGEGSGGADANYIRRLAPNRVTLPIIRANQTELAAHNEKLAVIAKASGDTCIWLRES